MSRTILSHFPVLFSSSSRLLSSIIRSGRAANQARPITLPVAGAGFRCNCTIYAPESEVSEGSVIQKKKRVVSGVQPTGSVHLGNYLGAIKNWVLLQDTYETLFFIADLHAITLPYDVPQLAEATKNTAAIYLACGVDASKASVFVQSHVHSHLELMWLLCSDTPTGWLNRMIQFKEKSRKARAKGFSGTIECQVITVYDFEQVVGGREGEMEPKDIDERMGDENVGAALLTYPVLMAADILLYQSDFVPVGEDQMQHLELTRELAEKMNLLYGGRKWKKLGGKGGALFKEYLVPEALIQPAGARVMSLTDGLSKMSKSAPSDMSRINLLDSKDVIANKIKRCKTDSPPGLEFDNPERPECNNLLSIYQLVTGWTKEEVALQCQNMNWGAFKTILTDALVNHLHPIQCRYEEITADPAYLDQILSDGAARAAELADSTLNNMYQAKGFLRKSSK